MSDDADTSRFYDRTAEYVAVLTPPAWTDLGPALCSALAGIDVTRGPIVDLGAGSGVGTAILAAAFPDAEIIAVESHRALRTALLTRLAERADLARRVTVLDTDALSAELPPQISGLAVMNVIGHFSHRQRAALWRIVAERLVPDGRAVINLHPPTKPEAVPRTPMSTITIGQRRYTGSATAEPAGPDTVTWNMTYEVEHNGTTVTQLTVSDRWHVFTPEQLTGELAARGLQLTPGDPHHGLQIITH